MSPASMIEQAFAQRRDIGQRIDAAIGTLLQSKAATTLILEARQQSPQNS